MAIQINFINNTLSKIRNTILNALGFTPENVANKTSNLDDNSTILYPSQKIVKDTIDAVELNLQNQIDQKQNLLFYDVDLEVFIINDSDYQS